MDFSEKLLLDIKKGISGTGALLGYLAENQGGGRPITLEPGDYVDVGLSKDFIRSIAAPIAYDLWYLRHPVNMLTTEDVTMDAIPQDYLDNQLDFLSDALAGMKPMTFIRNLEDLIYHGAYNMPISRLWANSCEYFIHLLAYETWAYGCGEQLTSDGPPAEYGFDRNGVVAYFAFPVGQLGVMEVVSLFCLSDTEADGFEIDYDERPNLDSVCEYFFPPIDDNTGKNKCFGRHLIESGYVVSDKRNVEPMATAYMEADYEKEENMPDFWMRYWLHPEETFPVPGDFVGILCKPLSLPPHIWWFQESSPFVYAGNWFETSNLTGGIITAVTLEAARVDGGIGNQYTVKAQGREIIINASDFYPHAVGDRVGILKIESVTVTPQTESFRWLDQTRITAAEDGTEFGNDKYVIIPIQFYQEV